jgi:hypothetical protein
MQATQSLSAVTRMQSDAEKIASDTRTHLLQAVTRMALELAQQVLPPYSHPKSPASSLSSSCGPALNEIGPSQAMPCHLQLRARRKWRLGNEAALWLLAHAVRR